MKRIVVSKEQLEKIKPVLEKIGFDVESQEVDPGVEVKPIMDAIQQAIQVGKLSQAGLSYLANAVEQL
jgi:hypothetical protein